MVRCPTPERLRRLELVPPDTRSLEFPGRPKATPRQDALNQPEEALPCVLRDEVRPALASPEGVRSPAGILSPGGVLSDTVIYDVDPIYMIPLNVCNFLLMSGSILVFAVILYAQFEPYPTAAYYDSPNTWIVTLLLHADWVLMAASVLVFLTASLGLLGGVRENVALLDAYARILVILIVVTCLVVACVLTLPYLGEDFLRSQITTDVIVHYRDKPDFKKTVDFLQETLRCCGITEASYLDWNLNAYFNCSIQSPSRERCSVPHSCCRRKVDSVTEELTTTLCGRDIMLKDDVEIWEVQ
ncbi:unnamed protein product [Ixodes hexagonus]